MKTVDLKRIVEYINSCNCTVIAITEPITMTSVASIQCSCKSVFNSVKQIYGFQRRQVEKIYLRLLYSREANVDRNNRWITIKT
jgi:hypothetical protein